MTNALRPVRLPLAAVHPGDTVHLEGWKHRDGSPGGVGRLARVNRVVRINEDREVHLTALDGLHLGEVLGSARRAFLVALVPARHAATLATVRRAAAEVECAEFDALFRSRR